VNLDLATLAGLIDRAAKAEDFAGELTLAVQAMKSGDLLKILKYDVEPALRLASILDPDPKVAMAVTVAIFGIEVFIAAKQSGVLDELIGQLPSFGDVLKDLANIDLKGADAQTPAMLRAAGNSNPQV
jgi:hypothetical protein